MAVKSDLRRRWLGAIFLAIAAGMVIAGQTFLRDRLQPAGFLLFWLVCLGFTLLAIFVAFLDVFAIRQRTRDEQRALFEETLKDIARSADADRAGPPGSSDR